MKNIKKEFFASSWAIDNRTSVFVLTVIITIAGLLTYQSIPKESFPEIVIPKIFITTVYPGTSPSNMENLVTKPLEKRMKSVAGMKKITSNSYQDYSVITVEFNTNVKIPDAKQEVKDAVDKARSDLPSDLPKEPDVLDVNLSELPILYINISGHLGLDKLKPHAEQVKDRIEGLKEITRVDMIGALDREIQINVDKYRMEAAGISLGDIERTIGYENLTISGGMIKSDGVRRTLNVKKEFKSLEELQSLIIKNPYGASVYLSDIAEIKDTFHEQESYARLDGGNVITLSVIKRAGENLIDASDKIHDILEEMKADVLPKDIKVVLSNDQSVATRITLHDLINTIVIGFILVTIILMFFMGATNAIFVAMSVPLSMFIAFLIMPGIGFTMNMIVLFSFLLALGIVVDDAIVVIENTHRIYSEGKMGIAEAAKYASGEVFLPVFSGTLTTLAPFVPLAFWKGVIGEFMFFLPITLIITLMASLLVAYIINPVFAVRFMKGNDAHAGLKPFWTKGLKIRAVIFVAVALLFFVFGNTGMGNLSLFLLTLIILHHFIFVKWIAKFQSHVWPAVVARYERLLSWSLERPWQLLGGTVGLFFLSFLLFAVRQPEVVFFPQSDPNFTYVYVSLPVGTDPAYTSTVMKQVEDRVSKVIGADKDIVSSVISNVTIGVTDPQDEDQGTYPNRGRLAVSFLPFGDRQGKSSRKVFQAIEKEFALNRIAGAEISVAQEQAGPPLPKPVNIEITGENLPQLSLVSKQLKHYLDSLRIDGLQELKSDFQDNKPEIVFDIDRERANREGISVGQIGSEIRKAVYGLDRTSKFRDEEDEYPIQVRFREEQRNNIEALRNMKITYRDMSMGGQVRQVPLSSFASVRYENAYGGIKRKNQKRIIALSSNVTADYQMKPNEVVAAVEAGMKQFRTPEGISIAMTGEQEEQKETSAFLGNALLVSMGLIFLILVTQFNSVGKPVIILTEIIFSIIGVVLGLSVFKMSVSIVMTGVGIVALAGIVVRNGILLVEFADLMRSQGMELHAALLKAGKTRMTPVILTASATILGLIPLAVGLNIDFVTLFSEFNPHIFFGGDSVAFWGPLSWTMIFGLSFATFLTLILVPVMYLVYARIKTNKTQPVQG